MKYILFLFIKWNFHFSTQKFILMWIHSLKWINLVTACVVRFTPYLTHLCRNFSQILQRKKKNGSEKEIITWFSNVCTKTEFSIPWGLLSRYQIWSSNAGQFSAYFMDERMKTAGRNHCHWWGPMYTVLLFLPISISDSSETPYLNFKTIFATKNLETK